MPIKPSFRTTLINTEEYIKEVIDLFNKVCSSSKSGPDKAVLRFNFIK